MDINQIVEMAEKRAQKTGNNTQWEIGEITPNLTEAQARDIIDDLNNRRASGYLRRYNEGKIEWYELSGFIRDKANAQWLQNQMAKSR